MLFRVKKNGRLNAISVNYGSQPVSAADDGGAKCGTPAHSSHRRLIQNGIVRLVARIAAVGEAKRHCSRTLPPTKGSVVWRQRQTNHASW